MAALIRPDLQQLWCCDTVKAGPVEPVITVMHFARDCPHQGHDVIFALGQCCNGLVQRIIIHAHDLSLLGRAKPTERFFR